MRGGASDFVQKPWDDTRLLDKIGLYASRAKQERTDIEIARNVQQNLLGDSQNPSGRSRLCGPLPSCGRDRRRLFRLLPLKNDGLGVALADVSGKGISAALLMAHLQAGLHSRPELANEPHDLISALNAVFWESSPSEQYATLFYGVYKNNTLRYANAGHASPVLLRVDGSVETLESTGMPWGCFRFGGANRRQ